VFADRSSVLQCNILQCVAVSFSRLKIPVVLLAFGAFVSTCVAVCYCVLQCVAAQYIAVCCSEFLEIENTSSTLVFGAFISTCVAVCVAERFGMLWCVTVWCSAVYCSVLQRVF